VLILFVGLPARLGIFDGILTITAWVERGGSKSDVSGCVIDRKNQGFTVGIERYRGLMHCAPATLAFRMQCQKLQENVREESPMI